MASLPLLSSRDGVQVVAALLGHARQPPHESRNIRALDRIFEEVVDSLRITLPLRADIETGAAAVASVLRALHTDLPPTSPSAPVASPALTDLQQPLPPPAKRSVRPRTRPAPDARPPRRPPRKKRYHDAVPSTHCHICCRPNTAVDIAVCSNIKEGTCRKVVCNRCITDNGWDWDAAIKDGSDWICPHCKDSCTGVPRAQCWVYMRTNSRRKMNGMKNKKARVAAEVPVGAANVATAEPPLVNVKQPTIGTPRGIAAGPSALHTAVAPFSVHLSQPLVHSAPFSDVELVGKQQLVYPASGINVATGGLQVRSANDAERGIAYSTAVAVTAPLLSHLADNADAAGNR